MNNDGLWSGYNNAAINPTGMRMNNNGMNLNNGNNNMGALNLMNAPVYRITRVHGTQGINELRMAPDCEGLFADETAPIIWHVKTDGAGYKTAVAYDIHPHQEVPPVDVNSLAARVDKLEALLNNVQQHQSNSSKQSRKQRQSTVSDNAADASPN